MKSELPKAATGYFKHDSSKTSLILVKWEEELPPKQADAYISTCRGDSGGGHWIKTDFVVEVIEGKKKVKKLTTKSVLVAIVHHAFPPGYTISGKRHVGPCGGLLYIASSEKYLPYAAVSIKTNYDEILNWVKNKVL